VCCSVAAMAVIDTKLVPVLIEKLQTELDEIKVSLKYLGAIYRVTTCLESLTKLGICKVIGRILENLQDFVKVEMVCVRKILEFAVHFWGKNCLR